MKRDPNAAADTTIMGVVHDGLRRDMARLLDALSADPPPDDVRRVALADHIDWMMVFLHEHHRSEDLGLWPLVRDRNSSAGGLLDRMDADHSTIAPAITKMRAAANQYRDDAQSLAAVVSGLDALSMSLLPHLRREEDEAMPVVAASITRAEWERWDQKYNVRGKSMTCLAAEGHWLMDGLDPDRYQTLVHLVPAPVRVVLVKGYAGRYRRACARRWGPELAVGPLARTRTPA
jgi:hemerythrin-like domain-containing protein